jgi:hypothetical protein
MVAQQVCVVEGCVCGGGVCVGWRGGVEEVLGEEWRRCRGRSGGGAGGGVEEVLGEEWRRCRGGSGGGPSAVMSGLQVQ